MVASKEIGFLTSTPIVLTLRESEGAKVTKPAEFMVTDLNISPTEAEVKQRITVSVKVINKGEEKGSYTIDLRVNGVTLDTKTVIVAGGESTIVTFELAKEVAGIYDIEVAGLKGKFLVKEIPPPPWRLYATITVAVIVAVGVLTIIYRKARMPHASKKDLEIGQ
jgi:hypothetical protein